MQHRRAQSAGGTHTNTQRANRTIDTQALARTRLLSGTAGDGGAADDLLARPETTARHLAGGQCPRPEVSFDIVTGRGSAANSGNVRLQRARITLCNEK